MPQTSLYKSLLRKLFKMENEITATANKYFKITPKSEQIETINSYMNNKDTVMVAPTGFGKSLIYQIAPLLFDKDKVYCQQQSSRNNSNVSSGREQAYGHSTTEFTDTSTPVRPERVPQQSSVSEEEDLSTIMEAMSLSSSNAAAALSLPSVTSTSEIQQSLPGPQVRRKRKVCFCIVK